MGSDLHYLLLSSTSVDLDNVFLFTISVFRSFHMSIQQQGKLYFLLFLTNLVFFSFSDCPLVLPVSKLVTPWFTCYKTPEVVYATPLGLNK